MCKIVKEVTLNLKEVIEQAKWILEEEWSRLSVGAKDLKQKDVWWSRVSIVDKGDWQKQKLVR